MSMCWAPKHRTIYSGSVAGKIYGWDLERDQQLRSCWNAHDDIVMEVQPLLGWTPNLYHS